MRNTKLEDFISGFVFVALIAVVGIVSWYNHTYKPYSKLSTTDIIYKTEHDTTVVTGNEVCLVYSRFNRFGFQADVIICEVTKYE